MFTWFCIVHTFNLPAWFEEGTAEFYSTLELSGDRLIIGNVIPVHLNRLAPSQWLTAETLASIGEDTPLHGNQEQTSLFYAQSWALVHMLNLSPKYRAQMPQFAAFLAEAYPADKAFQQAFGETLSTAVSALKLYIAGNILPTIAADWDPLDTVNISIDPISETEAELVQADLQLELGLWEISDRKLQRLANKNKSSPEVETARAKVAMSRGNLDSAKLHFEKAMELGSTQPATYFEYAMLLRDTGANGETVAENLEKTIDLNPNHAEANYLLGITASTANRHNEAVEYLQRAASLLPRRADVWHALTLAFREVGNLEMARRSAQNTLAAATTKQQIEMAEALTRLTEEQDWIELPSRPKVTTPEGWFNRQGDSLVDGILEHIECLGQQALLHVRSGDQLTIVRVSDPGKVVLKNASSNSFEFSCGPQKRHVIVEYLAETDAGGETSGEVTVPSR